MYIIKKENVQQPDGRINNEILGSQGVFTLISMRFQYKVESQFV